MKKRRTEKIEFLLRCEQEGGLTEALAEQQVAETELRNKQVTSPSTRKKAESALQNLRTQLRHQDVELYGKSQEYEESRQEQYLLRAELRCRERAHRDALNSYERRSGRVEKDWTI